MIDQKHLTVRNYIIGAIRSGRLRPGDRVPSEYALAARFHINKTTCNKAVSMLVADGYLVRRQGAGTFVLNEYAKVAPTIGVLINILPGSFFSHMLIGIQSEAAARGYGMVFFQAISDGADREKFQKYILSTGIKGIVINRPFEQPVPGLHNMYLNTALPNPNQDEVQTDDFEGGYLLGNHFVEMGHTHVAFVSQDIARGDLLKRMHGFQKAIDEHNLCDRTAKICNFSKHEQNLFSVLQRLLMADHRITGICFDSIHVASQAYLVLKRLGRRVPEDISIAGFGNLEAGEQTLRITTIDQHPLVLGHTVAEALINVIEGRTSGRVSITIPVELIRGDSVRQIAR